MLPRQLLLGQNFRRPFPEHQGLCHRPDRCLNGFKHLSEEPVSTEELTIASLESATSSSYLLSATSRACSRSACRTNNDCMVIHSAESGSISSGAAARTPASISSSAEISSGVLICFPRPLGIPSVGLDDLDHCSLERPIRFDLLVPSPLRMPNRPHGYHEAVTPCIKRGWLPSASAISCCRSAAGIASINEPSMKVTTSRSPASRLLVTKLPSTHSNATLVSECSCSLRPRYPLKMSLRVIDRGKTSTNRASIS